MPKPMKNLIREITLSTLHILEITSLMMINSLSTE